MKPQAWKALKRQTLLDHPRMRVVEDTVELPDGKTTTYIRQAPATAHSVAVIALNDKHEILLQKEYSYPPDKILWQLPGGGMREGETVITAANRELSEEAGLAARTATVIGSFYLNNRRTDMRQHVVVCSDLMAKPGRPDAEEFIENLWVPIATVPAMVAAGEFENVNLLAALYLWQAENRGPKAAI